MFDLNRLHIGQGHLGEIGKCGDDAIRQAYLPFNSLEVFLGFLGRGIAGVQQVIDRGLHDVKRLAQLVGHAPCHLSDCDQPLKALQAQGVFGLVSVFDDRQIQVQQLIQGANGAAQLRLRAGPRLFQDLFDVIAFTGAVTLTAAAGAETQASVTVVGAVPGDIVIWGLVEDIEGATVSANVNTADAVEFTLANATASTITIASAAVNGVVLRPKGNFEKD